VVCHGHEVRLLDRGHDGSRRSARSDRVPVKTHELWGFRLPRNDVRKHRHDAAQIRLQERPRQGTVGSSDLEQAQHAAGLQHAPKFAERQRHITDMPQRIAHAQEVRALVGQRNRLGATCDEPHTGRHSRLRHHSGARIDTGNVRGITHESRCLARDEPGTDPDVDYAHARRQTRSLQCTAPVPGAAAECHSALDAVIISGSTIEEPADPATPVGFTRVVLFKGRTRGLHVRAHLRLSSNGALASLEYHNIGTQSAYILGHQPMSVAPLECDLNAAKVSINMSDKALLLQQPTASDLAALESEIARLIVQALNLEIDPRQINPEARLYGEGLGLDSIDILEVALVVSKQYGIQLRADSEENEQIFRSLRHFAKYVAAQRMK